MPTHVPTRREGAPGCPDKLVKPRLSVNIHPRQPGLSLLPVSNRRPHLGKVVSYRWTKKAMPPPRTGRLRATAVFNKGKATSHTFRERHANTTGSSSHTAS